MSSDDWIKRAFDEAGRESDEIAEATEMVEAFMDECSTDMLDQWCNTVPQTVLKKFTKVMQDEDICNAVKSLCASFMLTGIMNERHKDEDN